MRRTTKRATLALAIGMLTAAAIVPPASAAYYLQPGDRFTGFEIANAAVADPAAGLLYVADGSLDGSAGRIVVADIPTRTIVASATAGVAPHSIVHDAAAGLVYVTNRVSGTISVFSAASRSVVATIEGLTSPRGLSLDAGAGRLYVAAGTGLTVVDTATRTVWGSVDLGTRTEDAAADPATGRVIVARDDGLSVVDGATLAVVASRSLGKDGVAVVARPSTGRFYLALVNNGGGLIEVDGDGNTVRSLPQHYVSTPYALAVDDVHGTLIAAGIGNGWVIVIDLASGTLAHGFYSTSSITTGIAHDPGRREIYLAQYSLGRVQAARFDDVAPQVAVTTKDGSILISEPAGSDRITGTASDDASGVGAVVVRLTPAEPLSQSATLARIEWAEVTCEPDRSCTWGVTPRYPGSYDVTARALDAAGNWSAWTTPRRIVVAGVGL